MITQAKVFFIVSLMFYIVTNQIPFVSYGVAFVLTVLLLVVSGFKYTFVFWVILYVINWQTFFGMISFVPKQILVNGIFITIPTNYLTVAFILSLIPITLMTIGECYLFIKFPRLQGKKIKSILFALNKLSHKYSN